MLNWPLLSFTIFLPLLGSLIIFFIKETEESIKNIKLAAFCTSIGTFIISCLFWFLFDSSNPNYQFTEKYFWFSDFKFFFHVGIDGISLFMVLLSTFLTPLCV
jgi:NADH-quinone oxidoreductase subunit M